MTRELPRRLLDDIRGVRIGVVGDFCLDAYWVLDASLSEISIETGLATRPVRSQRYSLGGAGNVVNNLVAMGVTHVSAFGVLGADPFGAEMLRILGSLGVHIGGMRIQDHAWDTPVYIKPVEGEAEQGRIDFGNANSLEPATGADLVAALAQELSRLDLLIINQQLLHGIHTEQTRGALVAAVAGARIPVVCDSRTFSDSFTGAIRKLNDREALRLCGEQWESEDPVPRPDAERAAQALFDRWKTPVFLTRGSRGILVRDAGGAHEVPGLQILGRIDTVGAGDSALAGIAAALAAGYDGETAARLGNIVAGVTVQKLFITGTATPREILALGTDPDYVNHPELADDPRGARYHEHTEIEVVSAVPSRLKITHAIFDNDGTISTLREGWESIMEPVMIRSILGPGWKTAEEKLYRRVEERVREYIDKTTGVQTLVQMQGLVEMVREFGVVPAAEVKDPPGYKAVYNEELLAMVSRRLAKLQRGELGVEDYTLKGALPLLKALQAAGVKLHLASGTDQEDLASEAKALGHAPLFEGRIHGAVGNVNIEAKKVVLERILEEIGSAGSGAVVTFGDGPVEIRETKRRGGFGIGVASDEVRRFGWNWRKRSRIIRAGADLVVPDFSQWRTLLGLLGVRA
jgi:bifunctional ADP-heptose synthase (sugar kinase/adenylyltransferase)/phosphoglycolate phosphatase-like HAD superfamily hydrolase